MSQPPAKTHDDLAAELAAGWVENTGCDQVTAEIRADQEMGAMHDAGECPVCIELERPRLVSGLKDLTMDEHSICDKISSQQYLLTYLPANGGTDAQIVAAARAYYDLRVQLLRSINPTSNNGWDIDRVTRLVDEWREEDRRMGEAEAAHYGY